MRKIFTSALFLCSFYAAHAQAYIPFPVSNTIWTERHGMRDLAPAEFFCYGMKQSDTVIGAVTYHKVYKSYDEVLDESEYCGGLREDTSRRIYFYDKGAGMERLLFDFTLNVGDTIKAMGPRGLVRSIDSVDIAGVYHRRINFKTMDGTPWNMGAWVEGIGNIALGGLLTSPLAQPTCDCAYNLVCFKTGSTYQYHNPGFETVDCFGVSLDVNQPSLNKPLGLIAPNPVQDVSRLNNDAGFNRISIYNITGALLYTASLKPQQVINIYKKDYAAGVYYYRLDGERTGTFTGKFVVQ